MSASRRVGAWRSSVMGSPAFGSWSLRHGTSPSLEFGRHEHERQRLLTALGTADGLPGLGRGERSKRAVDDLARVDPLGNALGKIVGDVEPLADAVDPICFVVGKTLRCRRPPQRLAEQRLTANEALGIAAQAGGTHHGYHPLARPLELVLLRRPGLPGADQRLGGLLEITVGIAK